jgi:predicted nucleic acid-binding protein
LADAAAINAAPFIHLSRAGLLSLLQVAAPRIAIPSPVADEKRAKGEDDVAVRALAGAAWLHIVEGPEIPAEVAVWDLGAGESAVLAWALLHPPAIAILDDRQARRCAAALHVPLIGTLGLVLIAKRRGLVPAARPILEMLVARGMYLSATVIEQALGLVGE